jgi:hypothetical protein
MSLIAIRSKQRVHSPRKAQFSACSSVSTPGAVTLPHHRHATESGGIAGIGSRTTGGGGSAQSRVCAAISPTGTSVRPQLAQVTGLRSQLAECSSTASLGPECGQYRQIDSAQGHTDLGGRRGMGGGCERV